VYTIAALYAIVRVSIAKFQVSGEAQDEDARSHDAIGLSVAFSTVAYVTWTSAEMFRPRPLLSIATAL
jgi:hypothetical protein